jgi:hypothetical protein
MWLFSCAYSRIWSSATLSSPRCAHTQGTHASKFCTPQCWEQLLQETPNVLVSTHRSRFQSFHSQACHQVSQTAHPILALKLHNLFEGQHANVCYATFDHELNLIA